MKNNGRGANEFYLNHKFSHFFIFLLLIKSFKECSFETPIWKNEKCVLEYCSKEEYNKLNCIIKNDKVKTQWITNIIWIGDKNFRYVNFATFSTGEMIIETTAFYPGSAQRIFYGLQGNGKYLFIKDGVYTPFYSKEVSNQTKNNNARYEAEVFVAKNKQNNKEYVISIPRSSQYIEIYDFEGNNIYQTKAAETLAGKMTSFRQSALNYIDNDNENYIIFCYSTDKGESQNKEFLYITKYQLTSLHDQGFQQKAQPFFIENIIGKSVSSFLTEKNYIISFYLKQVDSGSLFNIMALNTELDSLTNYTIQTNSFYENGFIKFYRRISN